MPESYLIDKAKLLSDIWDDLAFLEGAPVSARDAANYLDDLVRKQPTIEPEVRHGRWIPAKDIKKWISSDKWVLCSKCERLYLKQTNFCPNCGADMREEGAENG